MITEIALMIGVALIGLGLLLIMIFGLKNLIAGKHEIQKIVVMFVPFLIFAITYAVMGVAASAAMATMLLMLGMLATFILISGMRSSFKS